MITIFRILLLSVLVACTACGGNDAPATPPANATPPAATEGITYPAMPLKRLEYLWENSNYSDATYYYLPISTNQSSQEQVRGSLSYISEEVPVVTPACKPIGHLWYQVDGQNVEEADIYFSEGCTFYVWYENGQPAYSSGLTSAGIQFYNNILASAAQQTGQ